MPIKIVDPRDSARWILPPPSHTCDPAIRHLIRKAELVTTHIAELSAQLFPISAAVAYMDLSLASPAVASQEPPICRAPCRHSIQVLIAFGRRTCFELKTRQSEKKKRCACRAANETTRDASRTSRSIFRSALHNNVLSRLEMSDEEIGHAYQNRVYLLRPKGK